MAYKSVIAFACNYIAAMLESKEATAVTAHLLMPLGCPEPEWNTIWGKSTPRLVEATLVIE